jgi:uncharacterized protein YceK
MKLIHCVVIVTCLLSGCVAGSTVSHDDDPAAVKRDQGPSLCRDGTPPPCVPRG